MVYVKKDRPLIGRDQIGQSIRSLFFGGKPLEHMYRLCSQKKLTLVCWPYWAKNTEIKVQRNYHCLKIFSEVTYQSLNGALPSKKYSIKALEKECLYVYVFINYENILPILVLCALAGG